MSQKEPTTDSIYLTISELDLLIEGLNLSLHEHYQDHTHLPEATLQMTHRLVEIKSKFKWCNHCRNFFFSFWKEECDCSKGEEE